MKPLSTQLRPTYLEDFIGQEHLVGPEGPIRKFIETRSIPSMIFWGPPASGKTTLAEILAHQTESDFHRISAVMDGKNQLKKILLIARNNHALNKNTILFIDEIHRWSKSQQDALLPYVENGDITLIGATTENPSFTVISPLLSRSRIFIFYSHTSYNIFLSLIKACELLKIKVEKEVLEYLADISNGDMRFALNSLEVAKNIAKQDKITIELISSAVQKFLRHDKKGEEHYNLISAVHKSLRSSNPTGAVYWIMRMLEAGEDPLYIARRLLRFASEDIGNANPNALLLANQVYETCHKLGMPECNTALAQLAEFLAKCRKNNSAYVAVTLAREDIRKYGNLPVPMHFRNAPTQLMKDIGYGKGYEYDHNLGSKKSDQQCLPDELKDRNYY